MSFFAHHTAPDHTHHTAPDRDRGSTLPLVLVLVLIGSLIVLPMLQYSVTVFRFNRVVSDRAQDVEAAKSGLRVALSDPVDVFLTCNDGGSLPPVTVNGTTVSTTCTEVSEIGVAEALGGQVPYNVATTQIGASIPADFAFADADDFAYSGTTPPYPDTPPTECSSAPAEFWWCGEIGFNTDPDVNGGAPTPLDDTLWLPDLPEWPAIARTQDYEMPAGFDCRVYLPGTYDYPVVIDTSVPSEPANVYFASGVYYFSEGVTIAGDANVVVGYGLDDFGTGCADDRQVTVNLIDPPTIYGISGAGATWVFGENGRLVVDDSAGSPSIRFNQRYVADGEAGGRVSIMSVNGHVDGTSDHTVTHVNHVPRSQVLNGVTTEPIAAGTYVPSNIEYTDIAREPTRLDDLDVTTFTDSGTGLGIAQLEWENPEGNDLGGSLLGVLATDGTWDTVPFQVSYRQQSPTTGSWQTVCDPADIVVRSQGSGQPDLLQCTIDGLDPSFEYRFRVRPWAVDAYGNDLRPSYRADNETIDPTVAGAPDAPVITAITATNVPDEAQISWDAPNSDVVIEDYEVTAVAITQGPIANEAPVAFDTDTLMTAGDTGTMQLPVSDANGDALTITIDDSTLRNVDPTASVVPVDTTAQIQLSTLTPAQTYLLPYTVSDGVNSTTAVLTIDVETATATTVGGNVVLTLPTTPGPPTVTVDSAGLLAADPDAVVTVTGLDVDVQTTTATPPGPYDLAYTVTDGPNTLDGLLRIVVDPAETIEPGDSLRFKIRETEAPPALALPPYSIVIDDSSLTGVDPGASTTLLPGNRVQVVTTAATPTGPYTLPYHFTGALGIETWSAGAITFAVADPAPAPTPNPPHADDTRALAAVGAPITVRVPVTHPDQSAMSIAIGDISALTTADSTASVTVTDLDVTISTVAGDGTYTIPYTVTSGFLQDTGEIELVIDRTETAAGSCNPLREEFVPLHQSCTISGLTPIPTVANGGLGYQFDVVAISKAGTSAPATSSFLSASFDGSGSPFVGPAPLARIVTPYVPEPIIDISAEGAGIATVSVAGYVSVPMGRIHVDNTPGDPISLVGGVLTGTFDVDDGRGDGVTRNSVPIGYFNDIVLQRTVRITSVAGKRRSVAVVQVNEDGGTPGITSWFVY